MKNNKLLPYIKPIKIIFPFIIILLCWELISLLIDDNFFFPDLKETFGALINAISSELFFKVVFTSFYRVIIGLTLGIILGVLLATACHKITVLHSLLSPINSIMKATPIACIIVLLWIRFNYTQIAVLVVVLMVAPIVWQNVYEGYQSLDKNLSEVADVFEITGLKRFRILLLPTLLSYLLPAVVTSVGLAWKAEIAAEIMTNSNIGKLIYDFKTVSYDTASIFAWTIIIVSLSIVFEKVSNYFIGRIINGLKT